MLVQHLQWQVHTPVTCTATSSPSRVQYDPNLVDMSISWLKCLHLREAAGWNHQQQLFHLHPGVLHPPLCCSPLLAADPLAAPQATSDLHACIHIRRRIQATVSTVPCKSSNRPTPKNLSVAPAVSNAAILAKARPPLEPPGQCLPLDPVPSPA